MTGRPRALSQISQLLICLTLSLTRVPSLASVGARLLVVVVIDLLPHGLRLLPLLIPTLRRLGRAVHRVQAPICGVLSENRGALGDNEH